MQSPYRSSLDCALNPQSIAVIGASDHPLSRGSFIWKAVAGSALLSNAWPINPKYKYIGERPCLPNIKDIPGTIDLAVISLRADRIEQALQDVCDIGVRAVLITPDEQQYSSDPLWLARLQKIAADAQIRLIGPDSLGFMNPKAKINVSYWPTLARSGNIAFITQSGMIAGALIDYAQETELGFSGLINTGAAVDVDLPELIDHYANDPDTRVIAIHLEGLRNPRAFYSAISNAARKKHVVILKAGSDPYFAADRLASFKLGCDAGRHDAFVAMARRAGAVLIDSFEEFAAAVAAFSTNRLPRGNRLAVITNGSGFAALTAAAANDRNVDLHGLSNETISALQKAYPSAQIAINPINVGTTAPTQRYEKTLQLVLQDSMVDGVVVVVAPGPVQTIQPTLRALVNTAATSFKPVITAWIGDRVTRNVRRQLLLLPNAPISAVQSPVVAARAFGYLAKRTRLLSDMHHEPGEWSPSPSEKKLKSARSILHYARQNDRYILTLAETSLLLEQFGIATAPFLMASSLHEAQTHAANLGWPIALKVQAPGRSHQSEINGVHLDLRSEKDIERAWHAVDSSIRSMVPPTPITGVIIQKMVPHHALRELRLSITVDNVLGPVIEFGAGGLGAGLYRDQSVALPPLKMQEALKLLQEPLISRTFSDFRGLPPVNTDELARIACTLSEIATSIPAIQTLTLDPLIWTQEGFVTLDASVRLSDKPLEPDSTYSHMTIRPAPRNAAEKVATRAGILVLRSLEEEDYQRYSAFLSRLSGESLYFRFQTSTQLPTERIVELCKIDYSREAAWILVDAEGAVRGAARWHTTEIAGEAEFGIAVEDDWQGKGLASQLMKKIEHSALALGQTKLMAYVLPNNETMHGMLAHLGYVRQDASFWVKHLADA